MVTSQEKVHYVLAGAAGGTVALPPSSLPPRLRLLSDAARYQSATKLAFKLETNLLNNAFPSLPFLKLLVIHFAFWFTFAVGDLLGVLSRRRIITMYNTGVDYAVYLFKITTGLPIHTLMSAGTNFQALSERMLLKLLVVGGEKKKRQ